MKRTKSLYLIAGKSGSGKSTAVKSLEDKYGYKSVLSYTTRPPRYKNEKGHTFVSDAEFDKLELIAQCEFNGHRYGATKKMVDDADLYVVDLTAIEPLKASYTTRPVYSIYIDCTAETAVNRMLKRGDTTRKVSDRVANDLSAFADADKMRFDLRVDGNQSAEDVTSAIFNFIDAKENPCFDLIEIEHDGKEYTCLFSNGREKVEDFPGAFIYHCRGGNDPGSLCTLEHNVLVNHSGSVISAVEIPFDDMIYFGGDFDFDIDEDGEIIDEDVDDCHYSFLDNEMSFRDYMAAYGKRVDVLPRTYKHINDCWEALEECETVAEAENLINDFPRKFGEWYIKKNMFGDGYTVSYEYEDDTCVECDAQDFDWIDDENEDNEDNEPETQKNVYKVVYRETLVHTCDIEADSEEDAINEFNAMISRGEFDFSDGEIEDSSVSADIIPSENGAICPKCGKFYTERPAISREPGGADICPDCGMKEALADYISGGCANE